MKRMMVVLLALLIGASFGLMSPDLERRLGEADGGRLPVQIVLQRQFDRDLLYSLVDGLPRRERRVEVARILSDFAAREQADLLKELGSYVESGAVADIRPMWIVNAVYCEATPEVIRRVAARADVHYVNYDLVYCPDLDEPQVECDGEDEVVWGVEKIRAPEVWAQGFTGANVVCGHIDTGCDYTHPDLADHMWEDANYPRHGWNFENNTNDPMDVQGHGTHTAGTVASDGTSGSQCGVAPDARLMVCRVRTVADSVAESQCWQAMQFVVAPPLSPANGADLYTMSLGWMIAWAPHQATWRQVADNVNAAGVIQIIAAGNERGSATPPNALRCPGNVPPPWWNPQNTGSGTLSGVISIGATDASDAIAYFSSPGPVTWQAVAPYNDYVYPPGLTKPDVSAPGVDVKSCRVGGGYTLMSGTSMATPHVAGTVCLMLSKNPNLTPAVVDSILEVTAVDLGPAGKDNDFGAGRIDAFAAVQAVTRGPVLKLRRVIVGDSSGNNDGYIDPGETASLVGWLFNEGNANCANTVAWLRSFDYRLRVVDSIGTWGMVVRQESIANFTDRFVVQADTALVRGVVVPCSLYVTGDSTDYATTLGFELHIGMPGKLVVDHDTNNCRLSVTCQGAIGYLAPNSEGNGFSFPKNSPSVLRFASFAFGTDTNYVVDRYYSQPVIAPPDTDFYLVDSVRSIYPPLKGDEHFRAWYSDRNHPRQRYLVTTQNSYADGRSGYRNFVIMVFDVQNNGASRVDNFHPGVFADFTIDTTGDVCRTDTIRHFIYLLPGADSGPVVGIRVLEPDSGVHLSAIDPQGYYLPDSAFRDAQKWRFLSGAIQLLNPVLQDNWAVVAAAGPMSINPFGIRRFAVAFVGGASEDEALVNADSARSWYHRYIGLEEGSEGNKKLSELLVNLRVEVIPNPSHARALVRYQVPLYGRVRIEAVDVAGRVVDRLMDKFTSAGAGEIVWQPEGLGSGVYFIRMETKKRTVCQRFLLLQ